MLNSCGPALSQGEGSNFHPGCNWETTPPGYRACVRAWRWLAPHHRPHLSGLTMAAQKSWKNTGMLAAVANCGRSRKWGCRGRLALGFKPTCSSHDHNHHTALAGENHVALELPLPRSVGSWKAICSRYADLSLSSSEGCRRDAVGRKRVKGLLLGARRRCHGVLD